MNKLFIVTALLALLYVPAKSQDTVYLKPKNRLVKGKERTVYTDRPPQAVYAELYGRGLFFSVNYDRRFSNQLDGLGFSVGAGGFSIGGFTLLTVPVSLNYLVGNKGHYFETGVGATYANAGISGSLSDGSGSSGSTLLGTLTVGYRSQPVRGGFNFRAGLNLIAGSGIFTPYPYVSFGYNF